MGANMGTFNEVALESILSRYENKMELIRETEIYTSFQNTIQIRQKVNCSA